MVAQTVPLKAITDPGSLVKDEVTSDTSMYYAQGDYDNIVIEAHDESTWMSHVASPRLRPEPT